MKTASLPLFTSRVGRSKIAGPAAGFLAAAMLLAAPSARAASATWDASPTNGDWEATGAEADWSTGAGLFPGALNAVANTDVATFLTSSTDGDRDRLQRQQTLPRWASQASSSVPAAARLRPSPSAAPPGTRCSWPVVPRPTTPSRFPAESPARTLPKRSMPRWSSKERRARRRGPINLATLPPRRATS